jgi:thioredoxin reductase (NADPH)
MSEKPEHVRCLIIGSGPAGFTAAIYASRADLKPVMYQGLQPGGQLTSTNEVDNYPGYPKGVKGPDMMLDFENQAKRFGTDVRWGIATAVDFTGPVHKVTIDDTTIVHADTVIVATGATAKWLGLESEQKFNGSGVSACAVCDGFFYKGLDVAIVGAGDTAAEEATYLANLCKKVTMLVRRNEMRASKAMQHRVRNTHNIEVLWNTETIEVVGDQTVNGVIIEDTLTKQRRKLEVEGFFVAIGHTPNTTIFKNWLDMDEHGYLKTIPGSTRTKIEGVFACGDAQDKVYRQAVTAAGTGCMAALDAERYLSTQGLLK